MQSNFQVSWTFGANFYPSNAINQLEMWQADTFSPELIDRELGFAERIGMNLMRVFLHDLLYLDDPDGLFRRMEQYLEIANRHHISTLFVFFDDCHSSRVISGKQPDPRPGIHNSGWIQSPGHVIVDDPTQWGRLERYVKEVLGHFSGDARIAGWDLYNEPGNGNAGDHQHLSELRGNRSLPLLKAVFEWAREAAPSQFLTAAPWTFDARFDELNEFMFTNSDVVTFHSYNPPAELIERINFIRYIAHGRPVICTEYMARTIKSTFADCLPLLRKNNVGAINWGLVMGKAQTYYPWGWSAEKGEPELYFHDIFRPDGSLLYPEEAEAFKNTVALQ